eukprot:scaffold35141_cov34-Prasinocladus_malaysianus.AAC.1
MMSKGATSSLERADARLGKQSAMLASPLHAFLFGSRSCQRQVFVAETSLLRHAPVIGYRTRTRPATSSMLRPSSRTD